VTPSPFPEEAGRVIYLGGFDAATPTSWHNTAWIFRAEFPDERARFRLDGATPVVGMETVFGWTYQLEGTVDFSLFQPHGPPRPGDNSFEEAPIAAPRDDRQFYRWKMSR